MGAWPRFLRAEALRRVGIRVIEVGLSPHQAGLFQRGLTATSAHLAIRVSGRPLGSCPPHAPNSFDGSLALKASRNTNVNLPRGRSGSETPTARRTAHPSTFR